MKVDVSIQEYGMNRYDYQKKWTNLRDQSYEIITNKITQRRVVVAQIKCFTQSGNDISDYNF